MKVTAVLTGTKVAAFVCGYGASGTLPAVLAAGVSPILSCCHTDAAEAVCWCCTRMLSPSTNGLLLHHRY